MRARAYGWLVALAACGDGGGFPIDAPAEAAPRPGTFALSWTISGGTCVTLDATKVVVSISGGFVQEFDCGLGTAISGALEPGSYTLMFALRGTDRTAPMQTVVIASKQTAQVNVAF